MPRLSIEFVFDCLFSSPLPTQNATTINLTSKTVSSHVVRFKVYNHKLVIVVERSNTGGAIAALPPVPMPMTQVQPSRVA